MRPFDKVVTKFMEAAGRKRTPKALADKIKLIRAGAKKK